MASKANDQPSPADVVIEPADLRFEVSLSRASIQHLALRNLACGRPVAFKIKTTNPKRYLVRPNAGIVWAEGAATVSVQVGVQKALPQPGDPKSRDKFQVRPRIARPANLCCHCLIAARLTTPGPPAPALTCRHRRPRRPIRTPPAPPLRPQPSPLPTSPLPRRPVC